MPDTCVDVVFSSATGLQLAGTMTRAVTVDETAGHSFVGMRFRAAAVRAFFHVDASEVSNKMIPLEDIQGAHARELTNKLGDLGDGSARLEALKASVSPKDGLSGVQRALGYLASYGGTVRMDDICRSSGLSPRQLRRRSIEECGIGPKHLARIARFREASRKIARGLQRHWATLAVDCGYYDQAHLIHDFVEFSGMTPHAYKRLLSG